MLLLKGQSGSQSDALGTAATNVKTILSAGLQEVVSNSRRLHVPSNESTLVLASKVGNVGGELGGKLLELTIEVITDASSAGDKVMLQDLLEDGSSNNGLRGITTPGVELTVGQVGENLRVAVEVTGSLGLLGEGNHVRGSGQVPVLVGPELASSTDTSLDFINNEEGLVLVGDLLQLVEEIGGSVVVTTLRLNRLDDHSSDGRGPGLKQALNLGKAASLLLSVLLLELLKRVLESGERSLGPVKSRDIQLVDGLRASSGKRTKETAVESRLKGQNREIRRTRLGIGHGGGKLLLREGGVVATLLATLVHESSLVSLLVSTGAREIKPDLVQSLGGTSKKALRESVSIVVGREVSESGSVDNGVNVLIRFDGLDQSGVVVSQSNRSNLGVDIKVGVAINVNNVVTVRLEVIDNKVGSASVKDLGQLGESLLVLGARERSLHGRASRLIGVVKFGDGLDLLVLGHCSIVSESWMVNDGLRIIFDLAGHCGVFIA